MGATSIITALPGPQRLQPDDGDTEEARVQLVALHAAGEFLALGVVDVVASASQSPLGIALLHFSTRPKHLLRDTLGIFRGAVTKSGSGYAERWTGVRPCRRLRHSGPSWRRSSPPRRAWQILRVIRYHCISISTCTATARSLRGLRERVVLLLLRLRRAPFAEPDRRSQFGRPSLARHPKSTQEMTVYDSQLGRNRRSKFGQPSLADLPPDRANYCSSSEKQEEVGPRARTSRR